MSLSSGYLNTIRREVDERMDSQVQEKVDDKIPGTKSIALNGALKQDGW